MTIHLTQKKYTPKNRQANAISNYFKSVFFHHPHSFSILRGDEFIIRAEKELDGK